MNEREIGAFWSCSCNPPAVPYLGMYLTDLAFIEEGTPNFTEEGLVNFSKMRMVGGNFISSLFLVTSVAYGEEAKVMKVTVYFLTSRGKRWWPLSLMPDVGRLRGFGAGPFQLAVWAE